MKLLSVGIDATALLLALAVGAAPAIAAGSAGASSVLASTFKVIGAR